MFRPCVRKTLSVLSSSEANLHYRSSGGLPLDNGGLRAQTSIIVVWGYSELREGVRPEHLLRTAAAVRKGVRPAQDGSLSNGRQDKLPFIAQT